MFLRQLLAALGILTPTRSGLPHFDSERSDTASN